MSTTPQAYLPDENSFYDDLVTLFVSLSSYMYTMHVSIASNKPVEFRDRPLAEWISYIAPLRVLEWPLALHRNADGMDFVVYPANLLMSMSLGVRPQYIEYSVRLAGSATPGFKLYSAENRSVILGILRSAYVSYYSDCEDALKSRYGTNTNAWPDAFLFAWAVRNALAHTAGGKLKLNDKSLRSFTWKRWTFGPADNGREIILTPDGLAIGDIVLLIEEINRLIK